jgi:hypothetical protein
MRPHRLQVRRFVARSAVLAIGTAAVLTAPTRFAAPAHVYYVSPSGYDGKTLNVPPHLPADDASYGGVVHSVAQSQAALCAGAGCVLLAYLAYLLCCQMGASVPFATRRVIGVRMASILQTTCSAVAGNHLLHVLFARAFAQMSRIAAGSVVARMTDLLVIRNSAMCQQIGDAMRLKRALLPVSARPRPVPIAPKSVAHPWPARIRATALVNLAPEQLREPLQPVDVFLLHEKEPSLHCGALAEGDTSYQHKEGTKIAPFLVWSPSALSVYHGRGR